MLNIAYIFSLLAAKSGYLSHAFSGASFRQVRNILLNRFTIFVRNPERYYTNNNRGHSVYENQYLLKANGLTEWKSPVSLVVHPSIILSGYSTETLGVIIPWESG